MTLPLRMKRLITHRVPITWTRTAASLLACCLFLAGNRGFGQELPLPELPSVDPIPVFPNADAGKTVVNADGSAAPASGDNISTAIFTNQAGSQSGIQQTAQVVIRPKDRDEAYEFSVALELPGPERIFRRESEAEFYERIRQSSRVKAGASRVIFPEEQPLTLERYKKRQFPHMVKGVEPNYVCHGRLYFEQPNFERQGWDLGPLTPLVNVGVYYYDLALLPYHAMTRPFDRADCSAGKCLPGDSTPFYLYPEELSVTGLIGEATVVTGLFFLFP